MKVFPSLCGHQHMPLRYRKISASEKVCELRAVLCVVKKTNFISVFPKVILSPSFGMCGYPQILTEKAFTFCKLDLNPWTPILKNGKLLVAIWWSVVTYPSCCSNWSGTLTCAKVVHGMLFSDIQFLCIFSLIYSDSWFAFCFAYSVENGS